MCLSPVTLSRSYCGRKYFQTVPCGTCIECKSARQSEYISKAKEEAYKYGSVWFVTLTYSDDSVPLVFDSDGELDESGNLIEYSYNSLFNPDVSAWKKRVKVAYQRKFGSKLDLHFMLCGEYGPQTHRPHIHGIFFGLSRPAAQMLSDDWKSNHGFTCFMFVPQFDLSGFSNIDHVARYCAKYCCKVNEVQDELVLDDVVNPPRMMVSVGFGVPSSKRFESLRRFHLAFDLYGEYDPDTVIHFFPRLKFVSLVNAICDRLSYYDGVVGNRLPNYLKRLLFYKKSNDGKFQATSLQFAISKTLQDRIQKNYIDRVVSNSSRDSFSEMDYQSFKEAKKSYDLADQRSASERKKNLVAYNAGVMRSSKF